MNTKKIKPTIKVIVKDPKLVKIRDNLRTIIKLAVIKEYEQLGKLEDLYSEKRRIKDKQLPPSQFRREIQLEHMRGYLERTFVNSICVGVFYSNVRDGNIKGDRIRYSEIHEFDKDVIDSYGGRYWVEEKWFSLDLWEDHGEFLERYQKKMLKRMQQKPGNVITPLDCYLHELNSV